MVRKSRMFHLNGEVPIETWNPIVGCLHRCYGDGCWAARMALKIGSVKFKTRYSNGFLKPKLVVKELNRTFRPGIIVFVSSMGDMWGKWVPAEWILKVLRACERSPGTIFFFETKNPSRCFEFLDKIPKNAILSTTIETNRDYKLSLAPSAHERYVAIKRLKWPKKHISVEPIMDFDLEVLLGWLKDIKPVLVSVGYDNYWCNLPEPPLSKTRALMQEILKFSKVEEKSLRERHEDNELLLK